MRGLQGSNLSLDARRRRIRFRSWHRGMREIDLVLGRFADAEIACLGSNELDDYERLLEAPDRDVFGWLIGAAATPSSYDTPVLRRIRAFHSHAGPLHV
ncbi:MAG: succinate dehydrogenase assembly factor 2 [Methylocella sp.]